MSNPTVSQTTDNAVTEITGAEEGGAAILIDNVTKRYGGKKGAAKKAAVNQLTLEIPAGAVVMFVGRSGCGKTTTLKMINRLIEPTEGKIVINGEDVTHMNGDKFPWTQICTETVTRRNCRADSSSAWGWRAPWLRIRRCCSWTSLSARLTRSLARNSRTS